MNNIKFKFKDHPGDFFRSSDTITLPNPQDDLEFFLVQFLKHYQSDERVTYIDDLHKLIDNDFSNEEDKNDLIKVIGNKTEQEINHEIQIIESELKKEAYENFYNLVQTKQIEIIHNEEK
jgi:hypothetical protein